MIILISGGSGSGKSAFAERTLLSLGEGKRIYLATMQVSEKDEEGQAKIARHQKMRSGKGFETIECMGSLLSLSPSLFTGAMVLLEDLPNLLAGEMFGEGEISGKEAYQRCLEGLGMLARQAAHLVVVTGDIYREGLLASGSLKEYIECLGRLSISLAEQADLCYEVVAGIPLCVY